MSDIISSDHPLNPDQQRQLAALLDTLVPASEDGQMPSAADVNFDTHLRNHGTEVLPIVKAVLNQLDPKFSSQSLSERCEHVRIFSTQDPETFQGLLMHVYDCYYQDDRVREGIGMIKGPVFPQGNEVIAGDLSLLDPVIHNSEQHQYRKL